MRRTAAIALALGGLAAAPARAASVLRVCDDVKEPAGLDPFQVFTEKSHTLLQQMLEGLVRFTPDGRLEPALAVRWERVDPLTMRFHLRPGVRFHDGEVFDARAVKFSIERFIDPRTKFPGAAFVAPIERVDVVDARTVDVVTRVPDGLLLNRLAAWVHIVPPEYYAKAGPGGFTRRPVGTGPFAFDRWDPGRRVVLKANRSYWDPREPRLDGIEWVFASPERQVAMLLAGEVDVVTELPGTMTFKVETSTMAKVVKRRTLYTIGASLSLDAGALRSKDVRRALNFAIDKRELVRYDLLGNGAPVDSFVFSDYPETFRPSGMEAYRYDPARAKELIAAAGLKPPIRLRMLETKATRTARILAKQWERVGFKVDLVSTSDKEMIADVAKGGWDVFLGACPDPMHHPFFIHSVFLYSRSPFSINRSPELDARIGRIAAAVDEDERTAATRDLARYVNDQALSLFTYQRIKTYGVREDVEFDPPVSGMTHFRTARFTAGRARDAAQ